MLGEVSQAVGGDLLHVTEVESEQVVSQHLQERGQPGAAHVSPPRLEVSHVIEHR